MKKLLLTLLVLCVAICTKANTIYELSAATCTAETKATGPWAFNNGGSVKASEMVGFIKWQYATRSDISLDNAINNYHNFIIFTRPYSGEYYNVYTNRNYKYVDSYVCDYYIVFNSKY